MNGRAGKTLRITSASVAVVALLAWASPAGAVDIIEGQSGSAQDGWQAGTCQLDPLKQCSPVTPGLFFTQAAGHPPTGFTQIIVKHDGGEEPAGELRTALVDLPQGLSVNPQATPQCPLSDFESSTCLPTTVVGESLVTVHATVGGIGISPTLPVPVYNLEPKQGEPARFGFALLNIQTVLEAGVAWDTDYHEFFTIHASKVELPLGPLGELLPGEPLIQAKILKNRLVFNGTEGQLGPGGAFLTNPSTCFDPAAAPFQHVYSTFLRADSYQEPAAQFPAGAQELESPLPGGVKPTGCDQVPFDPSVGFEGGTATTDAPSGPTVEVGVPFDPAAAIANSNLRTARVTPPRGLGLNPSAAPGLKACTDKQFGKGTKSAVDCPAGSQIGTVAVQTPVLPPDSLTGKVYLGEQLSRDPSSGKEYRIFIDAEAPRFGQSVRLVGEVRPNLKTGQLTTTDDQAPQLPFTSVQVKFDGAKGLLTSPPTCGPNQTTGRMTPWSGTADANVADKGFLLTTAPGGGPCAKTMAERPFAPGFDAKPDSTKAAQYTDFQAQITRTDGQQELKGADITLPPGATAKLKGIPYCKPAELNDAAASSAAAEEKKSSCSQKSLVGTASTRAGSGPSPLRIGGKVFLAGPFHGAPLSLAVITPAAAGPFDLGTVVVRVALFVDPETAQVHPVADIPDVFGGAKLDIRSINVNVNRKGFARNGTNCRASATAGSLLGGGADPTNPATFSSFAVSAPFKGTKCKPLRFQPKLRLRLFGETTRAKHPKLRAVLTARQKDADIARASVALPHALFLDQASLATICTRAQFGAGECPKRSIYGHAVASSPLIGKQLKGPVYLRSSNNPLPDLVAHLKGQVTIDLVGKIDTYKGGIRTTFRRVPDVPVSRFAMTLPGGKGGLLVASTNLCQAPVEGIIQLKAQNGRRHNSRQTLQVPCG